MKIDALTRDEAVALIQTFYEAVVIRETDPVQSLNYGLHQERIHNAGNDIFVALTGLTLVEEETA